LGLGTACWRVRRPHSNPYSSVRDHDNLRRCQCLATRTGAVEGRPAFTAESCLVTVLSPAPGTLHASDPPLGTHAGSLRRTSVLRLGGGCEGVKDGRAGTGPISAVGRCHRGN